MLVTIWNNNSGAIATRAVITGYTEAEFPDVGEPIYGDPIVLERLSGSEWVRPQWSAERRADPHSAGAVNFEPGERILSVVDVHPALGDYDREGAMGAGVPDLESGTMTYTWAKISAEAFDPATHHAPVWTGTAWADSVAKSDGELAADLAARKVTMKTAITARRWVVETGGIILSGMAIASDALTQAKLSGALQLVQADTDTVIDWKGAAGAWVQLNAATVTAVAQAVGVHVQSCFTREKALHADVDAAANNAALDLINVTAGSIDGSGAWPANGS